MWSHKIFTANTSLTDNEHVSEEKELITASATEKSIFRTITFVFSVIMILCCICGAFGNIMSLIIFTRPCMRRLSVNVLLTGLSLVDLTLVLLAVPTFAINGLNDYLLDLSLYEALNPTVLLVLYPIAMMTQTCSIWTFVLISIERYYAVCQPLIVKRLLTVRRARAAQFCIFLVGVLTKAATVATLAVPPLHINNRVPWASFAIVYNSVRFLEYSGSIDSADLDKRLRENKFYFTFYYTSLYLITHFLIPFVIITTLNVHILRRLRVARLERERLSHAQQEQCLTTRMITVVTVLFGLCNCLPFVINVWEACDVRLFDDIPKIEWTDQDTDVFDWKAYSNGTEPDVYFSRMNLDESSSASIAYLLLDISNTLVVANAAAPFMVCLLYCKRYRKLFLNYCFYCHQFVKSDSNQTALASSSAYDLRAYMHSSSMETFTGMAANGFRSWSNTQNRIPRSLKKEPEELEQLNGDEARIESSVNGLVILNSCVTV